MKYLDYPRYLTTLENKLLRLRDETVKKSYEISERDVTYLAMDMIKQYYAICEDIEQFQLERKLQESINDVHRFRPNGCERCGGPVKEIIYGEEVVDKCISLACGAINDI